MRTTRIDYQVPGTPISLRMYIGAKLPKLAMQRAILSTHEFINSQIAAGNPLREDPFVFKRGVGAYFSAQSSYQYTLTWDHLLITLEGLYQALYERGRFYEVEFGIHVIVGPDTMIKVGTGLLVRDG